MFTSGNNTTTTLISNLRITAQPSDPISIRRPENVLHRNNPPLVIAGSPHSDIDLYHIDSASLSTLEASPEDNVITSPLSNSTFADRCSTPLSLYGECKPSSSNLSWSVSSSSEEKSILHISIFSNRNMLRMLEEIQSAPCSLESYRNF